MAAAAPRLRLRGHSRAHPTSRKFSDRIYTPSFSHAGSAISALGCHSQHLTVFSLADGQVVSQGDLGGKVLQNGGAVLAVPPAAPTEPEWLLFTSGRSLESYVPRPLALESSV